MQCKQFTLKKRKSSKVLCKCARRTNTHRITVNHFRHYSLIYWQLNVVCLKRLNVEQTLEKKCYSTYFFPNEFSIFWLIEMLDDLAITVIVMVQIIIKSIGVIWVNFRSWNRSTWHDINYWTFGWHIFVLNEIGSIKSYWAVDWLCSNGERCEQTTERTNKQCADCAIFIDIYHTNP